MPGRSIILNGLLSILWIWVVTAFATAADQPSVLILLADDLRPDAIGAMGNLDVRTPHLDALISRGTTFTRAYCMGSGSGAVCAPSRAMLLTGRHRFQLPSDFVVPWGKASEESAPPMLPERFRAAGWRTFGTGKWHQRREDFHRSFDEGDAIFFGGMGPHTGLKVHTFDPTGVYDASKAEPMEAFSSTGFADATIDFIQRQGSSDEPFFAWVAFTAPHDPRTPPAGIREGLDDSKITLPPNMLPRHPFDNGELEIRDEKLEAWPRTPGAIRRHLGEYYGMIEQLDGQVGRILDALQQSGRADDTIVLFLSDHGLGMGSHGLLGKQNLYEHSSRAPMVIAGPGIAPGTQRDQLLYLHDIVPWLYERAGIEAPVKLHALNPSKHSRESLVLNYRDIQRSLVEERWKLIVYPKVGLVQLFDLEADPHEQFNLAGTNEHAERVHHMRAALIKEMADTGDTASIPMDLEPAPDQPNPSSPVP